MKAGNFIVTTLILLMLVGCVSQERVAIICYSYYPQVFSTCTNAVSVSLPPCIYINPGEQIVIGGNLAIQNNVADPRLFLNIVLTNTDSSGENIVSRPIRTLDGDEYQLAFQEGYDNQIDVSVIKNGQTCVARLDVPKWNNVDVCVWHEESAEPMKMVKDIFIRRLKQ